MTEPGESKFDKVFSFATWSRWSYYALAAVLLIHFGLYLRSAVILFPFPYEYKGWADGQIMYTSWLLSQGENIYVDPMKQPAAAFFYTPGFQLLTAPLIRIFGNEMWVGRMVAIAGLILVWLLMYLAVRQGGGDFWAWLLSVGLLMSLYGGLSSHYDDIHPDSWCVAMGLASLVSAEAAVRRRGFWAVAALFAFLSFAFKQPGLSFAAGSFFFLLIRRPRLALAFGFLLASLIAAFAAAGQVLTDGMFIEYIFLSASRPPAVWGMVPMTVALAFALLAFSLPVIIFLLLDRPPLLPLERVYALTLPFVAVLYGSASIRRNGDPLSNIFPAAVLGTILLAVAVRRLHLETRRFQPKIAFLLLFMLLLQGVWLFQYTPGAPMASHYRAGAEIDRLVQSTPGEVLVFYRLSFAYRNHRPVYDNWGFMADPVGDASYHRRLEDQVRRGFFTRILIPQKAMDMWFREQPVYNLLIENYELEQTISRPPWHQTTPMLVYHRKPIAKGASSE